ncbi:IS66 family insertion sequence element accessory protein TnpB [Aliivibrio finisterrensis]|uniref:IS66 family insertion sequence element accessory protein TnpB n=1 Tax=Aliivibrio finisterrensis TaxID=511998 RepID=A0A6N6RNV2_9GAMM|nr:IS66 family insertion sequence element accessory protein TnpB [Aliivibrio finisterrensis]KAB2823168.1 IS66 family insertion sequence element accessory protein TnpB [Aliivibrio finisterrensis]
MIQSGKVYLVVGVTDMRKSIDGLSLIVAETLEMDPFSEAWFIFCNRNRDKLKILFWDTNGFWLYYRRLEKGTFKWPTPNIDVSA